MTRRSPTKPKPYEGKPCKEIRVVIHREGGTSEYKIPETFDRDLMLYLNWIQTYGVHIK